MQNWFSSVKTLNSCLFRMNKELLISTGIIQNASGSAYVELGNMKILCSIQGPRDSFSSTVYSDKGRIMCDFKYAPFAIKGTYKQTRQVSIISL